MDCSLHILLIDDNPDDRILVIRELRREFPDLQVEQIIEAKGFAQALEAGDFDLVITDYQLRWMDGLAVLRAVKTRWPDCPVIMFTATGSEEIAVEAMKAELDDYVLKSPKHFIRLPAAVRSALKRAEDSIERKRAERETEERRLYLEGVLAAVPDAIVTVDARHRIVEWNSGAERLFGYSREEAIGQNIDRLVSSPDTFDEVVGLTQIVMSGKDLPPIETIRYRKDGSPVDVIVAASPILVGDELIGAVGVYTDITTRVRMEETLRALLLIDKLTGLYNRRGFFALGQQQLKTAHRAKRRMMLLFTDFNGLKKINDALGHPEGDRALIETANVFRETFRESDIMARIGGDEFVILAIETNGSPAEVLVHRLQENLEARNARGDLRYELSLSVGLARYDPERPCSIDELLARADRAMYERKRGDQR